MQEITSATVALPRRKASLKPVKVRWEKPSKAGYVYK